MSDFLLQVRNANLQRVGAIHPRYLKDLDAVVRLNNLGAWGFSLPQRHPLATALKQAGSGVIASLIDGTNERVLFSGPTDQGKTVQSTEDPQGSVTFEGVTDDHVFGDTLAYPTPSTAAVTAQTAPYDVRTGSAESVMVGYLNANLGPSAPVSRRIPYLDIPASQNRGATPVTYSARFDVLGEVFTTLAGSTPTGFRIVQNGDRLKFEYYTPRDLRGLVRFSIENRSLRKVEHVKAGPQITRAIVAGGGEGAARKFVEVTTPESLAAETAWRRRIERLVDQRQTVDDTEMIAAGLELLVKEGGERHGISIEPVDTPQTRFAYDYFLGDTVTVVGIDGEVGEIVTECKISRTPEEFRFEPVLGNADLVNQRDRELAKARKTRADVMALERRK